jgi:hypothetical protein
MPRVKLRRAALALLVAVGSTAALAVLPAAAGAQLPGEPPPPPPAPQGAQLQIDVEGVKHDRVTVGDKVKVVGTLKPFVEGQKVQVVVSRADHTLKDQVVEVKQAKNGDGEFQLRSPRLIQPGNYKARAVFEDTPELGGASAESNSFSIRYPALKKGNGGHDVAVFNNLLAKRGYATSHGSKYTQITAWAVLAFRKIHGMSRIQSATSQIFRTLAEGKGAYEVQHPGAGRHAEVNLAKQVLVLADGD